MKIFDFCWDQEGHKGERSNGCMQCILLHLHLLTSLRSEFFYFGINNKVAIAKILNLLFYFTLESLGMWWWMWWLFQIFTRKIFLFTSSGYDMAPTCDSDTKNYLVLKTSTSESKISNIWPTLWHVWDMSKTFPTKIYSNVVINLMTSCLHTI